MDLNNIERNEIDFLLTDLLPTELPEVFTYRYFYEFLVTHRRDVELMKENVIKQKNKHNQSKKLFEGDIWVNAPLKYTIMKGLETEREISLLHPISGVEIFLFISAYQKELLYLLEENAVYSIRYHHKNNDLCYKNKNKSITKYFEVESKKSRRDILEHTGMFFNIKPYNSIASFTTSDEWMVLNSKYKYFARADYKACFDSIYTHTYTWIIANSVTDTKHFKNTNIYTTIDRLLMNINSRSSNGIVVGPEFSRMMAEVLLQRIDVAVYNKLLNEGYTNDVDYNIFRYVDDIFIFATTEDLIDVIISEYTETARNYLLKLNEQKLIRNKVPFVLEAWHKETNLYTNRASSLIFKSKYELKEDRKIAAEEKEKGEEPDRICLIKAAVFLNVKNTLMSHFNTLMCDFDDKRKTIVSYVLGMLLHKVSRNKEQYSIFRNNVSAHTVFSFVDYVLYIYSFFPDYNNTQKLLGIMSYIRDEFDFTADEHGDRAQGIFNKYAFIFEKTNFNDVVNLMLFYRQIEIEIPYNYECKIVESLQNSGNPLQWATYLLYSQYNENYADEIRLQVEKKIAHGIASIRNWKEAYIYHEFWWIIIFNKCPFISENVKENIDNAIIKIKSISGKGETPTICNELFLEFLRTNDHQFYEWNLEKRDLLREITFKTHERSIFKNYGTNLNFMDWTSVV